MDSVDSPVSLRSVPLMKLGAFVILIAIANKAFGRVLVGGIFGAMDYFWFRGIKPIPHSVANRAFCPEGSSGSEKYSNQRQPA